MTSDPAVLVEVDDGIGVLTLNSPATRNAITLDVAEAIEAAVDALAADESCSALIVTGAGSAFCAGAAREVLARTDREVLSGVYRAFLAVRELEIPTIAAVNGPAVGAGLNLALACDLRVAGQSAVFDARFLRLGVHGGGGVSWMLQRAVGPGVATAMLLFSETVDGPTAERIGLAWECVPDDRLLERSRKLGRVAAAANLELVKLTKDTLARAADLAEHRDVLDLELQRQIWSFTPEADRASWRTLLGSPTRREG